MEWEGKVARAGRVCAVSGIPLEPGATVYSAIAWADGGFQRFDFSEASWSAEVRDRHLSWWKHTLPVAETKPGLKLDANALEQLAAGLADQEARPARCLRYVVALALARMKAWRLDGFTTSDGAPVLRFLRRSDKREILVPDPSLTPADEAEVIGQMQSLIAG